MTRLLLRKYIRESALLFLACQFLILIFCWARIWIVCQFDLQKFAPLLEQFKAFERFSPVPLEQFLTYTGSIAMSFQEPVLIMCILIWAIARGSDVVSGELGRGTLEMLLAQPISRGRLLFAHGVVGICGMALLCFSAWLGIFLGIQTNQVEQSVTPTIELQLPVVPLRIPITVGEPSVVQVPLSEQVAAELYVMPTLNLFAFGFFVFALSVLCSCFDRYRWRTIGLVIGFYIIQLLLFILSKATDWTRFCENLSFFSLYQPEGMVQLAQREPQALTELLSTVQIPGWDYFIGPLGMVLLLIGMGLTMYSIGWLGFLRRDLPAPL